MVAEPIDILRARRSPELDIEGSEAKQGEPQTAPEEPARQRTRQLSTIEFPYYDLQSAVEVATKIHEHGGTQCDNDQLAAWISTSATSSAFKGRLSAVRMYGLIIRDGARIRLTTLGQEIVDPDHERGARARAFLNVELYRTIYDKFRGAKLPPAQALESEMAQVGVAPGAAERARWIFERAAEQAGFFEHGRDRLVSPVVDVGSGQPERPVRDERDREPDRPHRRPTAGASHEADKPHPFIQGLLLSLPPVGEKGWKAEERVRWLQAAAKIFDLMYGGSEDIHIEAVERDGQRDLYHR